MIVYILLRKEIRRRLLEYFTSVLKRS